MLDRYDENLILGYIEGDLDAGQTAQVERWLAADEQLRGAVEAMIGDRDMLRDIPAQEAPATLMTDVSAALERVTLESSAALPAAAAPAATSPALASPAPLYRFPRWARFTAAMAAMLALAAGLTWQLDPFGWNRPAASTEIALHSDKLKDITDSLAKAGQELAKYAQEADALKLKSSYSANQFALGHADAKANGISEKTDVRTNPPVYDKPGAGASGAGPLAAATPPPDKGAAALALAMESLAKRDAYSELEGGPAVELRREQFRAADGQQGHRFEAALANQAESAKATVAPANLQFELQVASARANQTRDAVLAWAKANGATGALDAPDGAAATTRARRSVDGPRIGAASAAKDRAGYEAQDPALKKNDDASAGASVQRTKPAADKAVTEPAPKPTDDEGSELPAPGKSKAAENTEEKNATPAAPVRPGAAPAITPATRVGDEAKGGQPQAAGVETLQGGEGRGGDPSRGTPRAPGAPAASGAPGEEKQARAMELRKALAGPADKLAGTQEELVLLVPEDRLDGLVQLLEKKTGQSLVIVSEQGQTLLVSPQVANEITKHSQSRVKDLNEAAAFGEAAADFRAPATAAAQGDIKAEKESDAASAPTPTTPASPGTPARPAPPASPTTSAPPALPAPGPAPVQPEAPSAAKKDAAKPLPAEAQKRIELEPTSRPRADAQRRSVLVRIIITEQAARE